MFSQIEPFLKGRLWTSVWTANTNVLNIESLLFILEFINIYRGMKRILAFNISSGCICKKGIRWWIAQGFGFFQIKLKAETSSWWTDCYFSVFKTKKDISRFIKFSKRCIRDLRPSHPSIAGGSYKVQHHLYCKQQLYVLPQPALSTVSHVL